MLQAACSAGGLVVKVALLQSPVEVEFFLVHRLAACNLLLQPGRPNHRLSAQANHQLFAQPRGILAFRHPPPQLLAPRSPYPVLALAPPSGFRRQGLDPSCFLEPCEFAINLLVRSMPEVPDGLVESLGKFGARARVLDQGGEKGVR